MSLDIVSYLKPYLVLEGMLYRVVPSPGGNAEGERADVERMYDNLMHRFSYRGMSTPGVYADYDTRKMARGHEHKIALLVDTLLREGDTGRALALTRKWQEAFSTDVMPHDHSALPMAECLYRTGNTAEADAIAMDLLTRSTEWLEWLSTLSPQRRRGSAYTEYLWTHTLERTLGLLQRNGREELLNGQGLNIPTSKQKS